MQSSVWRIILTLKLEGIAPWFSGFQYCCWDGQSHNSQPLGSFWSCLSFLFILFWNFTVIYLFFFFFDSFVYTWWAFQSRNTVRVVQLGQVSQENKDLLCIRSEWGEGGGHCHVLWRMCSLLLCLSLTCQRTWRFQGLCFSGALSRRILWWLQDIRWHLGCNCLCFWKVISCFFIFQMFIEVSLSLKFFLSYSFCLKYIFMYMCMWCVCVFTHVCTHTSLTIIWMGF